MKGNDFIKRIRKLGKTNGVDVRVDAKRGKGSHVIVYYGDAKTTCRNPRDELKKGTLGAMCSQLGISSQDL